MSRGDKGRKGEKGDKGDKGDKGVGDKGMAMKDDGGLLPGLRL